MKRFYVRLTVSRPEFFSILKLFPVLFFLLFLLAGFSGLPFLPAVFAEEFRIDRDFPGGNIEVVSVEKDVVRLRTEQRDSNSNWFYYAFRVQNAQGRTLHFIFDQQNRVGARGPAISADSEKTWRYLSDKPGFSSSEFTYTFGQEESSVIFAQAILYTQKNWDEFWKNYEENEKNAGKELRFSELCKGRKGRSVELLQFGNPDAKFGIALTCRHHCCEMIASYVLEGILQESLSDSDAGKWLRENTAFFVVPFIDKDGVEDGDQGKGRIPHDHNRDYNHEIYPEIRALKTQMPAVFEGKQIFFLDLHCPWIRSGMNEYLYSPMSPDAKMTEASGKYFEILEKLQKSGEIPYSASNNLPYGEAWNNDANYRKMEDGKLTAGSKMWAMTLPGIIFSGTVEMPFSNSSDVEVTRENSRELGRNLARAMAEFLKK